MKYGFIGCGNMGGAVASALSKACTDILLSSKSDTAARLAESLGCRWGTAEAAAGCRRVFLAVKPQNMAQVLGALKDIFAEKKPMLITMAAGLPLPAIEEMAGTALPIVRIMPNTPVVVGKGMVQYCCNSLVSEAALADLLEDMRFMGRLDAIEEPLLDAACSVSGCGPAFCYQFLDAMAKAGEKLGLSREKALSYAAATMAGAAEMLLQTGRDPEELTKAVCSPGGSTVRGVEVLRQQNLSGLVEACIEASYRRNRELGRQ